jgi:hypothetical protein
VEGGALGSVRCCSSTTTTPSSSFTTSDAGLPARGRGSSPPSEREVARAPCARGRRGEAWVAMVLSRATQGRRGMATRGC